MLELEVSPAPMDDVESRPVRQPSDGHLRPTERDQGLVGASRRCSDATAEGDPMVPFRRMQMCLSPEKLNVRSRGEGSGWFILNGL